MIDLEKASPKIEEQLEYVINHPFAGIWLNNAENIEIEGNYRETPNNEEYEISLNITIPNDDLKLVEKARENFLKAMRLLIVGLNVNLVPEVYNTEG